MHRHAGRIVLVSVNVHGLGYSEFTGPFEVMNLTSESWKFINGALPPVSWKKSQIQNATGV